MVTIEANFNFEAVDSYLNQVLKQYAVSNEHLKKIGEIVVKDIKDGLKSGKDISDDAPFVPNTPEWIKRKKNNTVYKGKTGKMIESIKMSTQISKNYGIIHIDVYGGGVWWQKQPKSPAYKRNFFGVSFRAWKKISDYLRKKSNG